MELRPRRGRSARSPSTPTISKPSPGKPSPRSASGKKSVFLPSSPILIPSNEDTNPHALLSPVLREENHENSLLVEGCTLSDFIKSGRKSVSSAMKQKNKAASAVKERSSSIAEQEAAHMGEFCTANDVEPKSSEMVELDDAQKCDEIVALDENEAAEATRDDFPRTSIELGEGKAVGKSKKLQSAKRDSTTKGGRGSERLSEETSHGKGTDAVSNVVNDQEHTLVAGSPRMPIFDEGHHMSLVLSDDENAPILSAMQTPVCEEKDSPSTSVNELHACILKTSNKKKVRPKRERFSEEGINIRLSKETPATTLSPTKQELRDHCKHERCELPGPARMMSEDGETKKVERTKVITDSNEQCCKAYSESLKETEQEPHDHFKHETCKLPDLARMMSKDNETKKVERTEEIANRNDQCCKPYSEGLKETDQTDAKVLKNDDEICVIPDAAVEGKMLENDEEICMKPDATGEGKMLENDEEICPKHDAAAEGKYPEDECAHYDVSEETSEVPDSGVEGEDISKKSFSTEEPSHQGCERDEEIDYIQDDASDLRLNEMEGDAVHHDQCSSTDDDNDEDVSSGSDEDEDDLASMFASSMKAHLHISESSLSDKSKEMQTEQDAHRGESPVIKDVVKGSHVNGSISRSSSSEIRWLPKVTLSESKNCQLQGGTLDRRPTTIWQKYKCLQDGLCLPPVDKEKLNKLARKQKKDTTGDKWYNLSAPIITPELKKELQLVKLRGVLDPKRHYKAEDSKGLPKYFQVGTVIGGPTDFYSGRLTKKERKSSLASELLSDSSLSAYRKRKFLEIQDQKQAGGKGFWKKKKNKRTPAWAKI